MNTDLAKKILEQNAVAITVAVEDGVCFMVREQDALDAISAALEAALPHLQPAELSETSEFDPGLLAWMKDRGIMPDAHEGVIEMDEVVQALSDYENDLLRANEDALAALQPVEPSVEEDVYCAIADMIEPYVQREGINPNGELPASVHDSVAILLDHWTKTRQPVGEVVVEATDAMVEAALQSTVSENAAPWRQIVDAEDHADFISDMRKAIGAALAARPSPLIAEATITSTQTVPDHCERIFWQSNYYQLPVGPSDLKKPTKRRQAAVELVQSLGYLWRDDVWTAPPAQQAAQVEW